MADSNPASPDDEFDDDSVAPDAAPSTTASDAPPPNPYPHIPGASVYTPGSTPSSTALNPRSCVTCRRRKVRCDKRMPCSNCRRAQIPCVFPAPGRAPRRPRPRDPNAPPKHNSSEREIELMKRLRKLEGIVEELSGQIELETARNHSSNGNSPEATSGAPSSEATAGSVGAGEGSGSSAERNNSQASPSSCLGGANNTTSSGKLVSAGFNANFDALAGKRPSDMHKRFGRLVIHEHGKTRYVSSAFWSKLTDELDQIRNETQRLTDEDSEVSDNETSPEDLTQDHSIGDHHAFLLGYRSADVDLRPLHPLPSQIPYIWQVFQENVDPLVKILHIPTMNKLIREIRTDLDNLTPSTEALMFSIYYSAITSLEDEDVTLNFGVEKPVLISRYRFALEQALAKAEFLTTSDIVTLQAFVIFLILVRRHDDTRFAWTLTGLVIRISQSIGLHRDGTAFPGLTPFQIEERRRLFWAIAVLDLRSAEDQGTDLTIMDRTFDTRLPLNINDSDIDPSAIEFPPERDTPTDMTFSLVRYEICALARRMHTVTSALAPVCPRDADSTLEQRERMLLDTFKHVEEKYLKDSSAETNPVYWVAANIARVIVAKMTLIIYQPVLFPGPGDEDLSGDVRDRLFNAAIDIFEYSHVLNTDPRCRNWRWLFQTYTQWHALAYILMEVSRRPWSATAERAWAALNTVFFSPKPLELARIADRAAVWLPFKKLYFRAKKHRDAEIARLRADPQAALALELEDRSRVVPKSFAAMSGSVKGALAIERWRKLVNAPPLPASSTPAKNAGGVDLVGMAPQTQGAAPQTTGAPTTEPVPQTAMEYMDAIMTQPDFTPDTFWPLVLTSEVANPAVQAMFLGGGSIGNIPRHDFTQGNDVGGTLSTAGPSQPQPQPQHQSTPHVDALKAGWGPPWMWAASSGYDPASTAAESQQLQQQLSPGLPELQPTDDVDVAMDEDFNWQDWGQSIRGFEVENSGSAAAGGIWGTHGI
ncbi:All development altered-3 [Pleurostoma richardsiae]|uniref:All development altered-3 n=1 Tax=Pleurostoma richardsiae TaxID=41990 RepID=A0AA38VEQ2_9PEZI|nr:All development altered-3 [Pleurostoma richardsiae]